MTREQGNLVDEGVLPGDIVTVNRLMQQQYRLNTNDRFDLNVGERLTVTRVNRDSLVVRTIDTKSVRDSSQYGARNFVQKHVSFQINREWLMFEDPNYVPPPPPRKLGQMPEGEGLIPIEHPGLQWLFDDMGKYAEEKGYCPEYDKLCERLGIPGRPRDFSVNKTINGIEIRATIKARSQKEANEQFAQAMAGGQQHD